MFEHSRLRVYCVTKDPKRLNRAAWRDYRKVVRTLNRGLEQLPFLMTLAYRRRFALHRWWILAKLGSFVSMPQASNRVPCTTSKVGATKFTFVFSSFRGIILLFSTASSIVAWGQYILVIINPFFVNFSLLRLSKARDPLEVCQPSPSHVGGGGGSKACSGGFYCQQAASFLASIVQSIVWLPASLEHGIALGSPLGTGVPET